MLLLRGVNELYYEEAFSITLGPSTGPVILLFKRFKAFWKNILISNFKPEIQSVAAAVLDFTADVSDFAFHQLEPTQQREDYRELLDLTLMFLGRVPPRTWCHSQDTVHVKIDTCICFENRPVQRCWIQANKERNTSSCRLLYF